MNSLREKIIAKTAQIGIIGLGYVGVPLAIEFGKVGFDVFGVDLSKERINQINKGGSYTTDVKEENIKAAFEVEFSGYQ